MGEEIFRTRHNVMDVSSLDMFMNIKGGINRNCKDVYFVRMTGANPRLPGDIEKMDRVLTERMQEGKIYYNRVDALPKLFAQEDIDYYSLAYSKWIECGKSLVVVKSTENNKVLQKVLGEACIEVVRLFKEKTASVTDSIEKNFIIKLFFWFDKVCSDVSQMWGTEKSMKLVISNVNKKQEYLFCYMLTLAGIDILLLQYESDIAEDLVKMGLSLKVEAGSMGACRIPAYEREVKAPVRRNVVNIKRADRPAKRREPVQAQKKAAPSGELSFEELALLASSVVMITINDGKGEVLGTGSGIMIGKAGYILTNNHVASGGASYSIMIEGDDEVYTTDEFIKYNYELDLAVLRIDRELAPLPIYKGSKGLVRGQRVVAIGSPLGLFNSVSDGIISGFRKIDGVDMIQFTAPTSHGSSGGAVLNMYGEVIGISTAGFDRGQNINLAMGYECINSFVRGFV